MEYLCRHPHALAHVERAQSASPSSSWSPRKLNRYQRIVLATAVLGFLTHVLVLALFPHQDQRKFLSNLVQFVLGLAAFFAVLDAGMRSLRAARWIWFYSAAAIGTYTLGQLIFIGYDVLGLGPGYAPRISDQFFFFWVVPLLAASAIDTLGQQDGFDTTTLLDFTQLLILGVVLHVFVFGDSSRWQTHVREMEFLKLKVRIIRDVVILSWLWGRAWLTRSPQLRSLFIRLGIFYVTYSVADAVYLYVEARWDIDPGTWLDLLWSLPRVLAVCSGLELEMARRGHGHSAATTSASSALFSADPCDCPLDVTGYQFPHPFFSPDSVGQPDGRFFCGREYAADGDAGPPGTDSG